MARTTKSRGKTNFKLDNSPYPLFKGLRKAAKNLFSKTPVGMAVDAMKGGGGGSVGERLDRIEQKLDQGNSGSSEAINALGTVDPAALAGRPRKIKAAGGGVIGGIMDTAGEQSGEEEILEAEV
jgi:hypothetical protein